MAVKTATSPEPLDLTGFTGRVAQAMSAFESDVTYAVLMARAAVTITTKRGGWRQRKA